jgi:peptidoglycan L-alanyl-D-glutamate endopeptidase CwlK
MATLSNKSLERLATCDPGIVLVVRDAIKDFDFTVLEGHRGEKAQNEAFHAGKSQLKWPKSNHNTLPSEAIDLAPWPIDWNDTARFTLMATHILASASRLGIPMVWGGHWKSFKDMPHFELVR